MEALKALSHEEPLSLTHEGRRWFSPKSLGDLAALVEARPDAVLLAGATDIGLWVTKQHRDLKSANVLLQTDGRVVVLDFGLVHSTGAASDGPVAGTLATMAPEQMTGKDVGPAADWFAVGCPPRSALFF